MVDFDVDRFLSLIKRMILLFLVSTILLTSTGCSIDTKSRRKENARKSGSIELYAACDSGADTVTALFMRDFAKRVEKMSNGRIKVNTYSDSQVGGDTELLEACKNGNIGFVFQTTAPQVPLIPQTSILDEPMMFDDLKSARYELDNKILSMLRPYYKSKGLELLGFADQGFREMTSNKKIYSIEDFKGIKIRTMENLNHIAFWKSIGSNPTPMSYAEVYIGLQQGTIDAQENPLEAIIAPRFYEQQKYLIMTNHILHAVSCIASSDIMDSLGDSDREIIYRAIDESKEWARKQTDIRFDEKIRFLKDYGIEIVSLDEKTKDEMKSMSKPVRDRIENSLRD